MEAHFESAVTSQHDSAAFAYARRLRREADFELLKSWMLLRAINEMPNAEFHVLLVCAAAEAANLALQTAFPLFVYPELFDEKVRAVVSGTGPVRELESASLPTGIRLLSRVSVSPHIHNPPAGSGDPAYRSSH